MRDANSMLTREVERALEPTAIVHRVLWLVLTGANVVYVAVAYLVSPRVTASSSPTFVPVLAILAACMGVVSLSYQRVALGDGRLSRRLANAGDAGHAGEHDPARSGPEARALALARYLRTTMIVSVAINELVALIGLVVALLTGRPILVVPFVAAAVLLNVGVAPRLVEDISDAWSRVDEGHGPRSVDR